MQTNKLPKPALVHCDSVMRAAAHSADAYCYAAGGDLRQAFKQAEQLACLELFPDKFIKCFLIQIKASQPWFDI